MKKTIFSILALNSILASDPMTVTAIVEPASIVGFDKTAVMGTGLITNTHTFQDGIVHVSIPLGAKFEEIKEIYIKTNTNTNIEMAISGSDGYGDLKSGRNTILVDYQLMSNTNYNLDGNHYEVLTSQANDGSTSVGQLKIKQHNNTPSDQDAGNYRVDLDVSIRVAL